MSHERHIYFFPFYVLLSSPMNMIFQSHPISPSRFFVFFFLLALAFPPAIHIADRIDQKIYKKKNEKNNNKASAVWLVLGQRGNPPSNTFALFVSWKREYWP